MPLDFVHRPHHSEKPIAEPGVAGPPKSRMPSIASTLKMRLRRSLKYARCLYTRTFRAFSPKVFELGLRSLGVKGGDTVIVHSSYDAFEGFTGKPTDVLGVLQRVVTTDGILMLPTMPFVGTAVAYAETEPVFDPGRTPSRTGLLPELFRRMPAVLRSIHPTHPVAVWGQDAAAVARDHHLAGTPCGVGTPYARLLERDGKILLLGADISSLTFYHTLEELLEDRFPVSPFTRQSFRLRSRAHDGSLLETETRLYEPAVSKRRNLWKLVPVLKRRRAWREIKVGSMPIVLLNARDVIDAVRGMADEGSFCYDD